MSESDLLPHPVSLNLSHETLEREYVNVTFDRIADPRWHFRLNLHRDTRVATSEPTPPTAEQPFQSLALFQRRQPVADLEIFGLHLPAEIDPGDWLDLWLEQHQLKTVSSKPTLTPSGLLGDCVCTWDTPQGPFAGRFSALRWSDRIFLLSLRTPRESYAAIADDYFAALGSFRPLEPEPDRPAEPLQSASITTPVAATVTLPASYTLQLNFSEPQITAFTADQQAIPAMPDDPAFGKLTLLLADHALADHPSKAAGLYLAPLLDNPITLHGDEFEQLDSAPPPFGQAWRLTASATFSPPDGQPVACELRCLVLWHDNAWFVAGVLGPTRHAAPIAWMRNKRALEIVTAGVIF
ncbi:MAG TPA: hypothetical protein VH475_13645 [Tepidisphaeraceae bacterium]|jgi:hypothetical protein